MDLESKAASLQSELDNATPTSLSRRNHDPTTWLPRSPARHVLQSHRQPVTCIAFHPIFSSLASGSEDTTIKIWDWELGELEQTVKGHTKGVLDVDFGGPVGNTLLASCSSDLTIKLWDPGDEYKNIRTLSGHDHSVSAIRFIPSGLPSAPMSGILLASASRDKTIRIWDVTTGYCIRTISGHADWVRGLSPSLDGRFLLTVSNDQSARMWDISTGEQKVIFTSHEHVVECCTFAPPSTYAHLTKMSNLPRVPALSSKTEFLATGGRDKLIKLWDARGTLLKTLTGHDNWIRALLFHPGGKYLLSCSDDKSIRCWDLEQAGKCVKIIADAHAHFVSCMRWAPGVITQAQPAFEPVNGNVNGKEEVKVGIRCVLATGSVDLNVRVFAS